MTHLWLTELVDMRRRVRRLRVALAGFGEVGTVDALREGDGTFAMLPRDAAGIERLQTDHGIYLAPNSRINIAGVAEAQIGGFTDALRAVQGVTTT